MAVIWISDADDDVPTPISLFKFAVNPHCFGQTVENFFHISFLTQVCAASIILTVWPVALHSFSPLYFQKGSAEISLDNNGLPVIAPCNPNQDTGRGRAPTKKQNLITLSMSEWKVSGRTIDSSMNLRDDSGVQAMMQASFWNLDMQHQGMQHLFGINQIHANRQYC